MRFFAAALGMLSLLPSATAQPAAPTAEQITQRVERFYASAAHGTATFDQVYWNETFQRSTKSAGTLRVKRPGKMRWDYHDPDGKHDRSFIVDGRRVWAIDIANKQAAHQPLNESLLPVAVTFLMGQGKLTRDFDVRFGKPASLDAGNSYVLELTPKKPSARFEKLWLVVDPKSYRVEQSIVLEATGNRNHFVFAPLDVKTTVKPTLFVVNERELRAKGFAITK